MFDRDQVSTPIIFGSVYFSFVLAGSLLDVLGTPASAVHGRENGGSGGSSASAVDVNAGSGGTPVSDVDVDACSRAVGAEAAGNHS